MSQPIDHPAAVAAAIRAVEEAWDKWQNAIPPKMPLGRRQDGIHFTPHHLLLDCGSAKEAFIAASEHLLAARRAAKVAGYVEVLVSRDSLNGVRSYARLSAECAEIEEAGGADDAWEVKAHAAECVAASTCGKLARDLGPLLKDEGEG